MLHVICTKLGQNQLRAKRQTWLVRTLPENPEPSADHDKSKNGL